MQFMYVYIQFFFNTFNQYGIMYVYNVRVECVPNEIKQHKYL